MLSIFRKLRRSFFLPGKVRTYCAYAAGEIVLIVVGILLALQISDWNQAKEDRAEEQQILIGLKAEFENHIRQLGHQKNTYTMRIDASERLLSFLSHRDSVLTVKELDEIAVFAFTPSSWDPALGVLEGVLSSGHLELLKNKSLQNRLSGWRHFVDEVRDGQLLIRDYCQSTLIPRYAAKGAPVGSAWAGRRPKVREWITETRALERYNQMKGDEEFIDLAIPVYARYNYIFSELEQAEAEANSILELIKNSLN